MTSTFLCPNTCGFGKILALEAARNVELSRENGESPTRFKARVLKESFAIYKENFKLVEENFNIDFSKFTKKLPALRKYINTWNFRKIDEKKKYLNTFSGSAWKKLSPARKSEHSFDNCKGCKLRYADVQGLFPVKSAVLKGKAIQNPVFNAANEAAKLRCQNGRVVKPSQRDIKNTAKALYNKLSPVFESNYGMTLAEALCKSPDLDLQYKSQNDKRSQRRNHYRQAKNNIENQIAETAFIR